MAGFNGDELDLEFGVVASVEVVVVGGEVSVTAGGGPVRVTGIVIEGDPVKVSLDHGSLRVSHSVAKHLLDQMRGSMTATAHISVVAPPDVTVKVRSVSADVLIAGFTEPPAVATVSGSVTVSEVGGLTASTVSGPVEAQAIRGDLAVNAVSGPVTILGGRLETTAVKAASGEILLDAEVLGDTTLTTVSGSVALRLPDDAVAMFDAATVSGRLDCAFPLADSVSTKRKLAGSIGGGGARLRVRTVSGDVAVVRKRMADL
ncbi:MAG: DUF4097 family beta strand repeat-containing protein [Acidimicrobiales bacterium]